MNQNNSEPCNHIIEAGITRTYVYLWVYHKGLSSLIYLLIALIYLSSSI